MAELVAERERQAHRADARGDVVGVDVDDRAVEALGEVGRPPRGARVVGIGGEADLVVLDEVQRAADRVAVQALQVERLRDDALRRERRVAVEHDRHGGGAVAARVRALARGLRGARGAHDDRVDELEVARVGLEVDEDRLAVGQLVGALRAVVVLDVAGAALRDRRDGLERRGALELGEDRVVRPPEVVGEHVEPPAVRHAHDDLARPLRGRELDELVEHRHRHVEALDRELLLAEVGLVHEALEGVDLDQPLEQRLVLVVGQRLAVGARLDLLAQPRALAVAGDVLDLVGDRAAVGLAQVRQRVGQRRAGHVDAQDLGRDPGHQLGREAERLGVERGVALGLAAERVEPGGEMAVGAVRLDQRGRRLHGLQQLLVGRGEDLDARGDVARGGRGGRRGGRLGGRAEDHAEVGEDLLVEAVLALQLLLDKREEPAGLRALDDAMVVGRRHRHDLLGPDDRADVAEPDRIRDRARGDDRALADHEPRDRGDRPDAAGVGERDVGAGEVVGGELVVARARDEVVEGVEELGEGQAPGIADDGDHQRARAVLLLDVDRDAEVHPAVVDAEALAVALVEVMGHHRHLLGRRARDRVGDEVGERDALARLLELLAPAVEGGDGHRSERGRGRDRARLVHVAGEHRRAAAQRLGDGLGGGGGRRAVLAEHVGLGDPPARPGALDLREVHALGGGDAAGDGGDMGNIPRQSLGSCLRELAWGSFARRCGGTRFRGGGAHAHARDDLPDGHRVAFLGEDLGDGAGGRRRQLHVDLVGGQLDDGLAVLHVVADLDGPLEDRALGDRLAAGGRDDVDDLGLRGGLGRGDILRQSLGCRFRELARGSLASFLRRGRGPVAARRDLREQGADLDGLALGRVDLDQDARGRRGDLGVDLVGGDLDEDLVGFDLVALLLVPLEDGPLGHRLAHHRHGDLRRRVHCHGEPLP